MILSKVRASGMLAEGPALPDFRETSGLPSSLNKVLLELLDGRETCDGRRYVSGNRPISAFDTDVLKDEKASQGK
jgi:hypothetical protein